MKYQDKRLGQNIRVKYEDKLIVIIEYNSSFKEKDTKKNMKIPKQEIAELNKITKKNE